MIGNLVELNNGVKMPNFGLGVWNSSNGKEVQNAVKWALDAGYRCIDTAAIYKNEEGVGIAIANSGFEREDIFITTKLWNSDQRSGNIRSAFDRSLKKLNLDYVDLYLIHWAVNGKFNFAWEELTKLLREGQAKAIGVSNFMVHHLEELLSKTDVVPAVNQVEYHPYLVQPALKSFCKSKNIKLQAWSPLMQGGIMKVQELMEMGKKYGKNAAQIVLRWNLQSNVLTIPKSANHDRIKSNADIFDFELSDADMQAIDNLDRSQRIGPDPDNFDF